MNISGKTKRFLAIFLALVLTFSNCSAVVFAGDDSCPEVSETEAVPETSIQTDLKAETESAPETESTPEVESEEQADSEWVPDPMSPESETTISQTETQTDTEDHSETIPETESQSETLPEISSETILQTETEEETEKETEKETETVPESEDVTQVIESEPDTETEPQETETQESETQETETQETEPQESTASESQNDSGPKSDTENSKPAAKDPEPESKPKPTTEPESDPDPVSETDPEPETESEAACRITALYGVTYVGNHPTKEAKIRLSGKAEFLLTGLPGHMTAAYEDGTTKDLIPAWITPEGFLETEEEEYIFYLDLDGLDLGDSLKAGFEDGTYTRPYILLHVDNRPMLRNVITSVYYWTGSGTEEIDIFGDGRPVYASLFSDTDADIVTYCANMHKAFASVDPDMTTISMETAKTLLPWVNDETSRRRAAFVLQYGFQGAYSTVRNATDNFASSTDWAVYYGQYAATQILVWAVTEGYWNNASAMASARAALANIPAAVYYDARPYFDQIVSSVNAAMSSEPPYPSIVGKTAASAPVIEVVYNASTHMFSSDNGTYTGTRTAMDAWNWTKVKSDYGFDSINYNNTQHNFVFPENVMPADNKLTIAVESLNAYPYEGSMVYYTNSSDQEQIRFGYAGSKKYTGYVTFTYKNETPPPTPPGSVQLTKVSARTVLTNNNACYDMTGITYSVYRTRSGNTLSDKVGELRISSYSRGTSTGTSTVLGNLEPGTYYVQENQATAAGTGYAYNPEIKSVAVASNQTASVTFSDAPDSDPVGLLLKKTDKENGTEDRHVVLRNRMTVEHIL